MERNLIFPQRKEEKNLIKVKAKRTYSCLNISMDEQRVLVKKIMSQGVDFETAVKEKDKKIKHMKEFAKKVKEKNKYTQEEMHDLFLQEFEKICRL